MSISFIMGLIIGAIIVEIVNIFFAPLKDWVYSKEKSYCTFIVEGASLPPVAHEIEINKKFRKTKFINCGHFDRRELIEDKYKRKYLHCNYGRHANDILRPHGYCPHDTESKKLFEK